MWVACAGRQPCANPLTLCKSHNPMRVPWSCASCLILCKSPPSANSLTLRRSSTLCRSPNLVQVPEHCGSPILCKFPNPVQVQWPCANETSDGRASEAFFFVVLNPQSFFIRTVPKAKPADFFFWGSWVWMAAFFWCFGFACDQTPKLKGLVRGPQKIVTDSTESRSHFFLSSLKRSGCIDGGMASMSKSTWKRARKRDFHQCCVSWGKAAEVIVILASKECHRTLWMTKNAFFYSPWWGGRNDKGTARIYYKKMVLSIFWEGVQ